MKGIYFAVPVCGEAYVQRWLRYGLPSLLSPGNLPALAKVRPVKMLLFSTHEDLRQILAAPAIKAARDVISLRVFPIAQDMAEIANSPGFRGNKFNLMNACHNAAVGMGAQDDYGLICVPGDIIYADGALAQIGAQIEAGKRAVVTQALDIVEDGLEALLAKEGAQRTDVALTVAPRQLVRVACQAVHPITRSMTWDAVPFTVHPSVMYWPLGGHGYLLRGWHLFPIFLYPDRKVPIITTIDGDYLGEALSTLDDCVFLDDSDQCCFTGVSSLAKRDFIPDAPHRADPAFCGVWVVNNTKPINRDVMIRRKIWFHDGVDRQDWRQVEAASDAVVDAILEQYRRLAGQPPAR